MMKMVQNVLSLLLVGMVLTSCAEKDNESCIGKKLSFDAEKYTVLCNPRAILNGKSSVGEKKFSIVTYFGAGNCNVCALKMMTVWDDVADGLGRDSVAYHFVFSDDGSTPDEVFSHVLSQHYFSFPVCLDRDSSFLKANPFVSALKTPVCLLTDADGIILDYGRVDNDDEDFRRFFEITRVQDWGCPK